MSATADSILTWTRNVLGCDGFPHLSLEEYLAAIPKLSSLADLPSGTPVLVRGDVDCKPGKTVGEGDIRLRSMKATLDYGRQRGWKLIVFGHIGREPEKSLDKVASRLGEILGCPVPLITDWLDNATDTIRDSAVQAIRDAAPGSVLMLQNTRAYDIERVLWKAKPDELPALSPRLAFIANEFANKIAKVYVNEAFSAGSLDTSSTVIPATMDHVALGEYVTEQFSGPMLRCLRAQLVIFSGLKADKLDDMEAIIRRGHVKKLFVAGSLAMALKKAEAQLAGREFSMGAAEDPAQEKAPFFVQPKRVEQARQMLTDCARSGIQIVLPVDFTLDDKTHCDQIPAGRAQMDIGPKTNELFSQEIGKFIDEAKAGAFPGGAVAFHNGVFGKFEESPFERATKEFVKEFQRMKQAGVEVYVGGGEGGTALERYGQPDWVTHCFTAGGTVLNALGSDPVPYLVALRQATR